MKLFCFPQTVVDRQTQEGIENRLIDTNELCDFYSFFARYYDHYSYCYDFERIRLDKKTGKKYIFFDVDFQKINKDNNNLINIFGRLNLSKEEVYDGQKVLIEIEPIKFYVCRELDYLIPTKALAVGVSMVMSTCERILNDVDKDFSDNIFFQSSFYYKYFEKTFKLSTNVEYQKIYSILASNVSKLLDSHCYFYELSILLDCKLRSEDIRKIVRKIYSEYAVGEKKLNIYYDSISFTLFKFLRMRPSDISFNFIYVDDLEKVNLKESDEITEKDDKIVAVENNDKVLELGDENFYLKEIDKLTNKAIAIIDKLSNDTRTDVYNKLKYLVEENNKYLEILKDSLVGEVKDIVPFSEPVYVYQDLYIKLTSFIRTLSNTPQLVKILNAVDNYRELIVSNNKKENIEPTKVDSAILAIINIVKLLDEESRKIIINILDNILSKYSDKISLELKSIVNLEVKLVLEDINYEEDLLNDISNVWDNIKDNSHLLLMCQILNCKNLLLDKNAFVINGNNQEGNLIQNQILEIIKILNSYSDIVRQEIRNKIDIKLNEYIEKIKQNNYNLKELSDYLNILHYTIENRSDEVNSVYNAKKIVLKR